MEHLDQDRRRHLHLVVRSGQSDQRGQSHPADTDANAVLHMAAMALFIPDDVGCGGVRGQVQHTLHRVVLILRPHAAGGKNQPKSPGQRVGQNLGHNRFIVRYNRTGCDAVAVLFQQRR